MNKLLMEENDRLQKQVSQLVYENSYFRQQSQNVRTLIFSLMFDILKNKKIFCNQIIKHILILINKVVYFYFLISLF